jgi:hypothetical protein
MVDSSGKHEKTEKRSKLVGGGRNKTENRPQLGCWFSFEVRSSDWPAQKLVGYNHTSAPRRKNLELTRLMEPENKMGA